MNTYSFRFLRGGRTNWGYVVVLIILTFLVAGGIFGYAKHFFEEITSLSKLPSTTGYYQKCTWKPTKDYGYCTTVFGVYYNGEECEYLSGCSTQGESIPFQSIEECQTLCE